MLKVKTNQHLNDKKSNPVVSSKRHKTALIAIAKKQISSSANPNRKSLHTKNKNGRIPNLCRRRLSTKTPDMSNQIATRFDGFKDSIFTKMTALGTFH